MAFSLTAIHSVYCALDGLSQLTLQPQSSYATDRVDITIGVMSRCPDALYFENAFSKALERVNEKINVKLTYIATANDSSPYGATCKHGDEECAGNIHQLCVIDALNPKTAGERYDLGPSAAQRLWWEFIQCENYVGGTNRIGEESLAKQCIQAIGGVPDWEKDGIEKCAKGWKGWELLQKSIKESKKMRIKKSATMLIEGEIVCIRDDGEWVDCSKGHQTVDWINQIEEAYREKNPSLAIGEMKLSKRQQQPPPPGPSGNGTTTGGPSTGNNGGQQGAPLSVFALTKRLPRFLWVFLPSHDKLFLTDHRHQGSFDSYHGSLLLQPRHGSSYNSTTNADPNPLFSGSFPAAYLAFGLVAIALFVLVVSFVLLRIFVRNRRLRRMGIYPEGPIDRFLGGTIREYEDTLPPPRLWEAKIADTQVLTDGMSEVKYEKIAFGSDAKGASTIKQRGWDSLMPISAALPPNLYPIIFENTDQQNNSMTEGSTAYSSNQPASRIALHMPQFLRRHTGEGNDGAAQAAVIAPSPSLGAAAASGNGANVLSDPTSVVSSANGERNEEKLAASVNVTVLIAMPSPRTILPSSRRCQVTKTHNANTSSVADPLQEIEEDVENGAEADGSSLKGKARRAPSLRSVKSTTSIKSVAEARREAFFGHNESSGQDAITSIKMPLYDEDEEDKELPELMFGTASIPIFTRAPTNSNARSYFGSPPSNSKPNQPSRSDILTLVAAANKAREKKAEVELAAAEKLKKQEEAEARRSVADTSIEGEGRSAITPLGGSQDTQAPLGDVAARMMRAHNVNEGFEMKDMRSSTLSSTLGESSAFRPEGVAGDIPTPSTMQPLLFRTASTETPILQRNDSKSSYPLTPGGELPTPISIMPLAYSEGRRQSESSFHTGSDGAEKSKNREQR